MLASERRERYGQQRGDQPLYLEVEKAHARKNTPE